MFPLITCHIIIIALLADDYDMISESLVFPVGSVVNTRLCRHISIVDDDFVENDESFTVSITSIEPVSIFPNSTKSITIVSNDGKSIDIL